jgi:hypothetical protein
MHHNPNLNIMRKGEGTVDEYIWKGCRVFELNVVPPPLTGWLLGGIDVERMERIKKDLET